MPGYLADGYRLAKVEALNFVTMLCAEEAKLFLGLHTFG
jgi:hypothetical protein